MNSTLTRRFASLVVFLALGFAAIFGMGCAAQGGSRKASTPHRRVLTLENLRGRQAERMPLRVEIVGNHTSGKVQISEGGRFVAEIAPGKVQTLYINWQWREHSPRIVLSFQKGEDGPIASAICQFRVNWDGDYVHSSTPIQTEVITLRDKGTAPSTLDITRSR